MSGSLTRLLAAPFQPERVQLQSDLATRGLGPSAGDVAYAAGRHADGSANLREGQSFATKVINEGSPIHTTDITRSRYGTQ